MNSSVGSLAGPATSSASPRGRAARSSRGRRDGRRAKGRGPRPVGTCRERRLVARSVVLNEPCAFHPVAVLRDGSAGGSKAHAAGKLGRRDSIGELRPGLGTDAQQRPGRRARRSPPAAGTRRWTTMPRKLAGDPRARQRRVVLWLRGQPLDGSAGRRAPGGRPAPAGPSRPPRWPAARPPDRADRRRPSTSTSCRLTERSAAAADGTSVPTSRWTTTPRRSSSRYSTGSSIVTTRQARRALRSSTSAASVVVFRCPGPPATSTSPAPGSVSSRTSAGSPSVSSAGTSGGISRSARLRPPRW